METTTRVSQGALQIALAEALGWKRHRVNPKGSGGSLHQHAVEELIQWEFNFIPPEYGDRAEYARPLHRWAYDLNEVRQVVMALDRKHPGTFMHAYVINLGVALAESNRDPGLVGKINAPPEICCEAILRTLNLWPIQLTYEPTTIP